MPEQMCPHCDSVTKQVKAGLKNGRQLYRCSDCGRRHVPDGPGRRYSSDQKLQAQTMRSEGYTLDRIARDLGATTRTVSNWLRSLERETSSPEQNDGPVETAIVFEPPKLDILPRRRATIRDVAERAGVGVSTVSQYMNGKGRIGAATRARIEDSVNGLHFTPSALSRAIRQNRTQILGLRTFGLNNLDETVGFSVIPPILTGISRAAEQVGHELLLYACDPPATPRGQRRFLDGHIDGLLWIAPSLNEPLLDYTAKAGLPLVVLLSTHASPNIGYVNSDNIGGIRMAIDHLLGLGRRRIGYFGPLYSSDFVDRYDGFKSMMQEAGLTFDPAPMDFAHSLVGSWTPGHSTLGVNCLVDMAEKLDAVVLASDQLAAQTIEQLRQRGFRVPDDIAVVGFDDIPSAATALGGITTIRQPFRQIGQVAVDRLLALIGGASASECRISLPTELIVRASTVKP